MENQNLQKRPVNRGNSRQIDYKHPTTSTPQSSKSKPGLPPKANGNFLVDKLMQNLKPDKNESVVNIDDLVSNSGQSATTQDRRHTDMETTTQDTKNRSFYGRGRMVQQSETASTNIGNRTSLG